jgi:hypothetical protein
VTSSIEVGSPRSRWTELAAAERRRAQSVVAAGADADRGPAGRAAGRHVVHRGGIAAIEVQVLGDRLVRRDVDVLLERHDLVLVVLRDRLAVDHLRRLLHLRRDFIARLRDRDRHGLVRALAFLVAEVPDRQDDADDQVDRNGDHDPRRVLDRVPKEVDRVHGRVTRSGPRERKQGRGPRALGGL